MPAPRLHVAPMSVEEAAAVLAVSRYTLIRFTDERYTPTGQQLRAEKTDRGWQIQRADLADFINRRSVTPHGEASITVTASELTCTYSLEQVAAEHGLSLRWLQLGVGADRIHHVKAGKARRMTSKQVARTLQMRQAGEVTRSNLRGAAA